MKLHYKYALTYVLLPESTEVKPLWFAPWELNSEKLCMVVNGHQIP